MNLIYQYSSQIRFKKRRIRDFIFELYSMNICRFFEPHLWTLFNEYLPVFWTLFVNFIQWISAGFLNLICKLYVFEEYLLVFWTLYVSCIDKKIKLKKTADLFDGYLPVFWTLFMNCIYSKNGIFMTLFMNFIRWIKTGRFIPEPFIWESYEKIRHLPEQ